MPRKEPGSGNQTDPFQTRREKQRLQNFDLLGNPRWLQLLPDLDRLNSLQVALQLDSEQKAEIVARAITTATHIEEEYSFFAHAQGKVRKKIEQAMQRHTSRTVAELAKSILALPPVVKANSIAEAEGEDPSVAHLDDYRADDESKSNEILEDPERFKNVFMTLVEKANSGGPNQAEREYALMLAFKQAMLRLLSQQDHVDLAPTRLYRLRSDHEEQKPLVQIADIDTFRQRKQSPGK